MIRSCGQLYRRAAREFDTIQPYPAVAVSTFGRLGPEHETKAGQKAEKEALDLGEQPVDRVGGHGPGENHGWAAELVRARCSGPRLRGHRGGIGYWVGGVHGIPWELRRWR